MRSLHISLNTAHSGCKPSTLMSLSTHSPSFSIPPLTSRPCHLHLSTGRYPIIHTPRLQMLKPPQSTPPHCHASHSVHPENCTNPHCISYSSVTPRTSISPSSVPFSPNFADWLSSSPRFQSHMSMHSGHKPYISSPLRGMMHSKLSGYLYESDEEFTNDQLIWVVKHSSNILLG